METATIRKRTGNARMIFLLRSSKVVVRIFASPS
jgi:hypothetical protein